MTRNMRDERMLNNTKKYPAELVCISINMEKTGANLKRLIKTRGYSVDDIMAITGISSQQAIYKWYSGKSLPSVENALILCKVLGVGFTELLVIDGDFDDDAHSTVG